MKTVVNMIFILLGMSVVLFFAYTIYMGTKKRQYPKLDFSRFKDNVNNVDEIESMANNAIRGVNGWMWLATAFMSLHYFLNFWSIVFMLLNIVVVAYKIDQYRGFVLFLVAGSLVFTCVDLWIDSKEKCNRFHKQWFKTSIIARTYIVKFAAANTFDELCNSVIEFNDKIYKENESIQFL